MAAAQGKVIITCAVTGAIHTPTMSPHLPITPEEIAEAAIGAAKAGAAIVHLHARDAEGRPPDAGSGALPPVPAEDQGGERRGDQPHHRRRADDDDRGAPAARAAAQARGRLAQHGLDELRPLRDDRALQGVASTTGRSPTSPAATTASSRTPSRTSPTSCESCSGNDTRFEIECYDIGHLYTAAHFLDRGLVKPPLFIQSVFGIRGGIGPHPEDVLHMKRTADRLFGDAYQWSVLGAGRNQMFIAAQSAVMGGNVRVGLEDSLWIGRGQLAKIQRRAGARRSAASWRSSASRSPRRTRRARCSSSRAAAVAF